MSDTLHDDLRKLEAQGANWQRIMVAHALVDLGYVTAIECMMPNCLYESRRFVYGDGRARIMSIDHALALSAGGDHLPDNLRLAHHGCNSAATSRRNDDPAHRARLARRRERYARLVAAMGSSIEEDGLEPDVALRKALSSTEPWQWLASTRVLQRQAYKIDYSRLKDDDLADYVVWNSLALIDEVHEFLQEVNWKPWANDRGKVQNRDAAVGELVDVGHFIANLACALGVSDEEWEVRYREKQARNATRQSKEGGYDAHEDKCPVCRRELDKEGSTYRRNGEAVGGPTGVFCKACDTRVGDVLPDWTNT